MERYYATMPLSMTNKVSWVFHPRFPAADLHGSSDRFKLQELPNHLCCGCGALLRAVLTFKHTQKLRFLAGSPIRTKDYSMVHR